MLIVAGAAAATVAVASTGRPAARAPAAPPVHAAPDFWPDCGLHPVELGDELRVNGSATKASVAWTTAAPEAVIACHRTYFETLPVDLHQEAMKEGRLLAIFDNLHGTERMVSARRAPSGTTEVVRGTRPLGDRLALVPEIPDLPLMPELLATTLVEDGSAVTASGLCAHDDPAAALTGAWRGTGWTVESVQPVPPGAQAALAIHRGARSGLLVVGRAPCTFTLRLEDRS